MLYFDALFLFSKLSLLNSDVSYLDFLSGYFMLQSKRLPQVALLIETSNAYARGLLKGITSYVREHRPWSIYLPELGRGDAPPDWIRGWHGDGIIARIENDTIAKFIEQKSIPVIDVSTARLIPNLLCVETDDKNFAEVAAQHFFQRGFKHLAFCGDKRFKWSENRRVHFLNILTSHGINCHVHDLHEGDNAPHPDITAAMQLWLKSLPQPVGIFCCYDILARMVLDNCRSLTIPVPEEVAVLGVDNDELICDLCHPPLSSVIPNTQKTGYLAAQLLDQLMNGQPLNNETHLVESLGVATRQSTDMLAIEDQEMIMVLRYIREHACEGIQVSDILKLVSMSRRVLESRFRKAVGRTPHEEIARIRIERVKELLAESEVSIEKIALRTGFEHPEYLTVAFKRETGISPSEYRKRTKQSSKV
jgi:LacI family transcriptional regulator